MNNADAMDNRSFEVALNCAQCGYDLRSQSPTGNCPECNAPVSAAIVRPGLRIGSWQLVRRVRTSLSIIALTLLINTLFAIAFVLLMLYWYGITDRSLRLKLVQFLFSSPPFTEAAVAASILVFVLSSMTVPGVLRGRSGQLIISWILLVLAGQLSARWVSMWNYEWLESWPKRVFAGLLWIAAGSSSLLFPIVPALLLRMIRPRGKRGTRACLWVGFVATFYFVAQAIVEMGWCAVYAMTARPEPGLWSMGNSAIMPLQLNNLYSWFGEAERTYGAACCAVVLFSILCFLRASTPPHAEPTEKIRP